MGVGGMELVAELHLTKTNREVKIANQGFICIHFL